MVPSSPPWKPLKSQGQGKVDGYLIKNIHNLQDHCSEAQAGISFKQLSWVNLLVCLRKVITIEQGLPLGEV